MNLRLSELIPRYRNNTSPPCPPPPRSHQPKLLLVGDLLPLLGLKVTSYARQGICMPGEPYDTVPMMGNL